MIGIPRRTLFWTIAVVVATAVSYVRHFPELHLSFDRHTVIVTIILFGFIVASELLDVTIPYATGDLTISVTAALALGSAIELGPFAGATVVMVAMASDGIIARRETIKTVVNVAVFGLASLAAGSLYLAIADLSESPYGSIHNIGSLVAACSAYALVNSWLIAAIIAPIVGTTSFAIWRANLATAGIETLALATLGGLIPVLADEHPLALIVLLAPLMGPYLSFKGVQRVHQQTRETVERLTDALERRDTYTHNHSVRVADLVAGILAEMPQVPFEKAETIRFAARVHDLGKVGVRDAPLNKPGPLDPSERLEIEQHPVIGEEIIERLEVYRDGAELVRHHHERWDGRGYPDGLAGESIPLGSRIIAVADTFDAMTSNRAYRRAMTVDQASREINRHSGVQFDPVVVAAFERFLQTTNRLAVREEPTAKDSTADGAAIARREPLTPLLPSREPSVSGVSRQISTPVRH